MYLGRNCFILPVVVKENIFLWKFVFYICVVDYVSVLAAWYVPGVIHPSIHPLIQPGGMTIQGDWPWCEDGLDPTWIRRNKTSWLRGGLLLQLPLVLYSCCWDKGKKMGDPMCLLDFLATLAICYMISSGLVAYVISGFKFLTVVFGFQLLSEKYVISGFQVFKQTSSSWQECLQIRLVANEF